MARALWEWCSINQFRIFGVQHTRGSDYSIQPILSSSSRRDEKNRTHSDDCVVIQEDVLFIRLLQLLLNHPIPAVYISHPAQTLSLSSQVCHRPFYLSLVELAGSRIEDKNRGGFSSAASSIPRFPSSLPNCHFVFMMSPNMKGTRPPSLDGDVQQQQ